MALQHTHTTTPFVTKKFPLVVLCDGVSSPANAGGLFRICEAFGVDEIVFYNGNIDVHSSRLKRTARQTHKLVNYSVSHDIKETLRGFKKLKYDIIALEVSDISIPSEKIVLEKRSLVLIIGNEQHGISEEVLALTPKHMHIEMFGKNSSMNVVQASSIALYTLVHKLNQLFE